MKSKMILLSGLVVAALGGVWFYCVRSSGTVRTGTAYYTEKVSRGNISDTINATGTIEPEELINVGAQVGGRIMKFGRDLDGRPVDYGSRVEEGTILAEIDDALYFAEVKQAEAQLQQNISGIAKAKADLVQLKARFNLAEREWKRSQQLFEKHATAQTSYDAARSAFEVAEANLKVGEAAILQAEASRQASEAQLSRAKYNYSYCVIKSPVRGVIIDRRVNIGQTVVSSFSTPSLFLIAKDLKKMQVWVSVNEADIGKIKVGMPVIFTVDTFPDETFRGSVGKIRLNASLTQNVVTYIVEVQTDNSSNRLLPYLTANTKFIVKEAKNVLLVPNSALRWSPRDVSEPADGSRRVWIPDSRGEAKSVPVRVLMTDGVLSAVEGSLSENDRVITGTVLNVKDTLKSGRAAGGSPFLPKMKHPRSKK